MPLVICDGALNSPADSPDVVSVFRIGGVLGQYQWYQVLASTVPLVMVAARSTVLLTVRLLFLFYRNGAETI